ncbi:hypothetical protein HFD88_001950 [Aspergillus terreus]|nr:hypothetical protein HFD88_001950 [Aspergillus terreus]
MSVLGTSLVEMPAADDGWTDDELYDDHCVSPLSDKSPRNPGTNFVRLFPELASLVSPMSTTGAQPLTLHGPLPGSGRKRFYSTDTDHTADSSLCSNDLADSASSCYSRRSSVTSVGSEPSRSVYRSADAFSIISPIKAGVFDDSVSVRRAPSTALVRSETCDSSQDKPLPREPAIQLAPLAIRNSTPQSTTNPGGMDNSRPPVFTRASTRRRRHQPTLSQAAEELENALAGVMEPGDTNIRLSVLDAPLQISRGNMDMIPSRPPPLPPIDTRVVSQMREQVPPVRPKHQRKFHRSMIPFSFSIPVFHRRHHRVHGRTRSSPDVLESPTVPSQGQPAYTETETRMDVIEPPKYPHTTSPRPLSADGERKLRAKLPRLWTSTTELVNQPSKEVDNAGTNPHQSVDKPEEKVVVSSSKNPTPKMNHQYCELEAYPSAPEMIYELDSGPARKDMPLTIQVYTVPMPTMMPDNVVLALFKQVCSLDDLFHLATISRQFYRVFKAHELELIKRTVFTMSPPAWELREMSPPWDSEWQILVDPDAPVPEYTASNYLRCYAMDIYTLAQLKSLILARCGTFLRPETVRGLAGLDTARAAELDDAFWRIWTFCRIFGSGKNREGDILGQLDWLNGGIAAMNNHKAMSVSLTEPFGMNNVLFEPPAGFARGNLGGLSQSQLYDMTEIWNCLGVLLQPIHGKCKEARETGIFEGHNVSDKSPSKEEAVLEEWTFYILSLGPSAVLNLGSICPADNGLATFQRAKVIGLTRWEQSESGISRASFLKEAVSKAYKPREEPRPRGSPRPPSSRSSASHTSNSSTDPGVSEAPVPSHRRRQTAYAEQLRNRKRQPGPQPNVFAEERPISNYGFIMNRLAGLPHEQAPLLPVSPSIMTPLSPPRASFGVPTSRSTPSAQPVRTAPSNQPAQPVHTAPPTQLAPSTTPMYRPQVRDPVDQALELLVGQLGFAEEDAKWALKITDTGEGINADAAVDLLFQEQQRLGSRTSVSSGRSSLVSSVMGSQASWNAGWRWA